MTTSDKIKVMQAQVDGKQIEFQKNDQPSDWKTVNNPSWNWTKYSYRVKDNTVKVKTDYNAEPLSAFWYTVMSF